MKKDYNLSNLTNNDFDLQPIICKRNLFEFIKTFWNVAVTERFQTEWYIEYICGQLQLVGERLFKIQRKNEDGTFEIKRLEKIHDLIINVPPGTSKTSIVNIFFPCWLFANDPTIKIINASYSMDLSTEAVIKSRDVIESELYQAYFINTKTRKDKRLKTNFELTAGGGRFATSVGSGLTGFHAHLLINDDIISVMQGQSDLAISSANNWISSVLSTRTIDPRITPMITVMQRVSEKDPTQYLLDKGKRIKHICLPAEVGDNVTPAGLTDYYVNGLLSPTRFNDFVLKEKLLDLGEYHYAAQFLQRPDPIEGLYLKKSSIKTIPKSQYNELKRLNSGRILSINTIDSAESRNDNSDETGVLLGSFFGGVLYAEAFYHFKLEFNACEAKIQEVFEKHNINPHGSVNLIEYKSNGSAIAANANYNKLRYKFIENRYPKIAGIKSLTLMNKFDRFYPFIARLFEQKCFVVVEGCDEAFINQLITLKPNTNSKRDEAVDNACMMGYYCFKKNDYSGFYS